MKSLIGLILFFALTANSEVTNVAYHEFSRVTIHAFKNGKGINKKDLLVKRSPLRAKSAPWNCQDNHGLRKKSGTVFVGSPYYDILPLTWSLDYDYWTIECHSEGEMFYVTLKQPSPDQLRKKGWKVNDYYETIHNKNPEKVIRLLELPELLAKSATASYECRLYNNKIDNDGIFYGCVQKSKTSVFDYKTGGESLLDLTLNVIDDQQPINVAKRFAKLNKDAGGKIQSVALYGSAAEASGVELNGKKPVTMAYEEYLKRAIEIDNESYILTDN